MHNKHGEKAVKKEAKCLIYDMKVFKIVKDVGKHVKVIPLMLMSKCKINKHGLMDKLKGQIVFQGNLYTPKEGMDLWNSHAAHDSLKLFLGSCARDDMDIIQVDCVMVCVQTKVREHVLVMLPEASKQILLKDMWKWISILLLLVKALHECTYSCGLLCDEQAAFLFEQGFQQT